MNGSKNLGVKNVSACIFVLLFSLSATFGQVHFSGFAGVAGNIGGKADGDGAEFLVDSFFSGQIDLFGKVQIRAGATVNTGNLFSKEIFTGTPAQFKLDEFSVTARIHCCHLTRYLTLFAGEYESIGSDLFLQRHFGILPVNSRITESWMGITGTSIYPFSNLGASFVWRLVTPQAFGAYIYYRDTEKRLNADVRFAGVFPVLTVDFALGMGFPLTQDTADDTNSLNLNRNMELHSGLTMVIGNAHTASLFMQVGITKVILNPDENEKALKLSDFYFLIEPRFKANFMNFHFTLFNLPERIVDDLFFISNNLGCNLGIFAENVYVGMFNLTMGAHLTVSVKDATLEKLDSVDINKDNISFQVAPFAETSLSNGTLMARLTMDFMQIQELHKTIEFTLGYKVRL